MMQDIAKKGGEWISGGAPAAAPIVARGRLATLGSRYTSTIIRYRAEDAGAARP
jgi:hypothetical protein